MQLICAGGSAFYKLQRYWYIRRSCTPTATCEARAVINKSEQRNAVHYFAHTPQKSVLRGDCEENTKHIQTKSLGSSERPGNFLSLNSGKIADTLVESEIQNRWGVKGTSTSTFKPEKEPSDLKFLRSTQETDAEPKNDIKKQKPSHLFLDRPLIRGNGKDLRPSQEIWV
ncbi:hypothetical protein EVAR_51299_1 [Eumeta japonica]|uniref:Uncharacterized protein n=1 Tax=Eumeta variegata TaxID=151549 RepID=A0A4C1XSI9_EUMVA|nr:hypothetical protein EVAR_51299_1 [Eumeta japonica]